MVDHEPGNALANNALAIIASTGDTLLRDEEEKQQVVSCLSRSFLTDKHNPLTLKLIAEHLF